ncbi:3-deoxy-manno-octulosonate cytidylyltransferase [Aspergillus ambiguus]|uniref:3-deoxy-manno-octulosonate cytidylyltransferase family protein n=1 Tax=Aspergillus ambiguus TaxID=176160 RepID=UPI003CCDDFAA
MHFIAIIPARFESTRLPGKVLADIHGKPMIAHVIHKAKMSGAQRVIVATDHPRVAEAAQVGGAETCLTSKNHRSGTERLSETVDIMGIDDDEIVVNVQGDEPCIDPELITQVAYDLSRRAATDIATLATPIEDSKDVTNSNIVKVVLDIEGNAMYFSRAIIPWDRDAGGAQDARRGMLRHVGLYAYRAGFLRQYIHLECTILEELEKLEQLRALYHQKKIHVSITRTGESLGVDTEADLEKVRNLAVGLE